MPCPLCGRNHGGHERGGSLDLTPAFGICVCSGCSERAKEMNRQQREETFYEYAERDDNGRLDLKWAFRSEAVRKSHLDFLERLVSMGRLHPESYAQNMDFISRTESPMPT